MEKKKVRFRLFFGWIGAFVLMVLSLLKALFYVHIDPESEESVLYHNGGAFFVALFVILAALFLCYPLLERLPEHVIFLVFTGIYLLLGGHWMLHASLAREGDPAIILGYVQSILRDADYAGLSPERYLGMYPYLMGFLNYEKSLWTLWAGDRFLFLVNLAWVLLIDLLLWRLSVMLFPDRPMSRKYGILFSFCFFPLLFLILFLYGTIPGLGCSVIALWCAVRGGRTRNGARRWLLFAGEAAAMAAAVLLKPDYLIFAIALTLCQVFHGLCTGERRWFAAAAVLILCASLAQPLLRTYYRAKTGYPLRGIPIEAEIATGLQEHPGSPLRAGRYNGYEYDAYEQAGHDGRVAAKLAAKEIAVRGKELGKAPGYAAGFFLRKLQATWCEPTFESVVTGPAGEHGGENDSELMKSLYEGDWAFFFYEILMNAYLFLLYLLAFAACLRMLLRKERSGWELFPFVYLTGGVLYHLVGETKSLCAFMYVAMLLPAAADMAAGLFGRMRGRGKV